VAFCCRRRAHPTRHSSASRLDKEKFRQMIQTYYGMMGWDSAGVPLESTLIGYQLEWLLDVT
jgi:aldehyde:ferredoxin oxidoreductase